LEIFKSFPINSEPEVFGLHENAEITTNENNTIEFMNLLATIKASDMSGSNAENEREETQKIIADIRK
jgi:dynein heavy chain